MKRSKALAFQRSKKKLCNSLFWKWLSFQEQVQQLCSLKKWLCLKRFPHWELEQLLLLFLTIFRHLQWNCLKKYLRSSSLLLLLDMRLWNQMLCCLLLLLFTRLALQRQESRDSLSLSMESSAVLTPPLLLLNTSPIWLVSSNQPEVKLKEFLWSCLLVPLDMNQSFQFFCLILRERAHQLSKEWPFILWLHLPILKEKFFSLSTLLLCITHPRRDLSELQLFQFSWKCNPQLFNSKNLLCPHGLKKTLNSTNLSTLPWKPWVKLKSMNSQASILCCMSTQRKPEWFFL